MGTGGAGRTRKLRGRRALQNAWRSRDPTQSPTSARRPEPGLRRTRWQGCNSARGAAAHPEPAPPEPPHGDRSLDARPAQKRPSRFKPTRTARVGRCKNAFPRSQPRSFVRANGSRLSCGRACPTLPPTGGRRATTWRPAARRLTARHAADRGRQLQPLVRPHACRGLRVCQIGHILARCRAETSRWSGCGVR
jgi:hypothetical protein